MKKSIIVSTLVLIILGVVSISFANDQIMALIENFKVFVDGTEQKFSNPIITVDDRTYLPLREVAELLDCNIGWDGVNQMIEIQKEQPKLFPFKDESTGLWGYQDQDKNIVIQAKYVNVNDFSEGLACVRTGKGDNGQYMYIDENDNVIISGPYYGAYDFSEGIALIRTGGPENYKYHYIDKKGNRLFDKEFEGAAGSFSNGYAYVMTKYDGFVPDAHHKWSYIDKQGELATEMEFDSAKSFRKGVAIVKLGNQWGLINTKFEFVVPCEYDDMEWLEDGRIQIQKNGETGYIDIHGNVVKSEED